MERIIKRGDVFYAELNPVVGSEQGGTRPVLIISNNTGTDTARQLLLQRLRAEYTQKQNYQHIPQ